MRASCPAQERNRPRSASVGLTSLASPRDRVDRGPFGLQVWTWVGSILEGSQVSLGVSLMHMCSSER